MIHLCELTFVLSLLAYLGFLTSSCKFPKVNLIATLLPLQRPASISYFFLSMKSSGNSYSIYC